MSESAQRNTGDQITGPATPDDTVPVDDGDGTLDGPLPKDDLFHLLQNSRRRAVVRYLQGRTGAVRMRDIAEQVAAWENDTTLEALTSDQRQRVYIALYQSHLETLEDAGVIEYNKPRGVVEPTPRLEEVADYVDAGDPSADEGPNDGWEEWYLSVSLVGSILLFGTVVDITVFQYLSTFVASALILMLFSLLTVAKVIVQSPNAR